jgi:hypothetical protein
VAVRAAGNKQWMFLLNHTPALQTLNIRRPSADLLTGEAHDETIDWSAYAVCVLQAA